MTDIEVFKCPSNAILNISPFDETVLILVQCRDNNLLQSIFHELSDELQWQADQRDVSEIIHSKRVTCFWNESDKSSVNGFQIQLFIIEVIDQIDKLQFNSRPTFFRMWPLKPSGPRALSGGISFTTASISSGVKGYPDDADHGLQSYHAG
jgi:hypothetical protein